jgi:hypothetical protein
VRILTLIVLAIVATACGTIAPSHPLGSTPQAARTCAASVDRGVLPVWARSGFTDPQPVIPHSLGRSGEIMAILFGDPLLSPPGATHANKILWVTRPPFVSAPTLEISAQRMDGAALIGAATERHVDGGPGPSIIDLPDPGCWRLTLTWADKTDVLDLEYVRPA